MRTLITIPFIVSAGIAGTTPAAAQSSVTIFGVADAGVRYVRNGDSSQTQLSSGNEATSKLGFRGVEDLGGGLKAGFWLENQLSLDTGVAGVTDGGVYRLWHRRSTVSLYGGWGELRLGRAVVPTWQILVDTDPFTLVGVGNGMSLYPAWMAYGSLTRVRADNGVHYLLPSGLGGVYGHFAVAPGEGKDGGKYTGGRLGWRSDALDVSIAVSRSPVADKNFSVTIVGAKYTWGDTVASGSYQRASYGEHRNDHLLLGISQGLGPGRLKASYESTKGHGLDVGRDAQKVALGYVYDLSKRTAVYGTVARMNNRGKGQFVVAENGFTPAAGTQAKSTGIDLGMRYSF